MTPAGDPQAIALAHDGEAGEGDDRAEHREHPRDEQDGREGEDRLADGVGHEPLGRLGAHHVVEHLRRARDDGHEDAERAGGQRGAEEGAAGELPRRRGAGRRLGRVERDVALRADQIAELPPRGGVDRLQHDLALRAAPGGLDVDLDGAEQALDRAADGVDRLHAVEGNGRDALGEHPAPQPDRGLVDPPARRLPLHERDPDRQDDADHAEHQQPVQATADDRRDEDRQRERAQLVDALGEDGRRMEPPRCHRASGPARRRAPARARPRPSPSAGIATPPAAVWKVTVARSNESCSGPDSVSTCCTRRIGTSVRFTTNVPWRRSISSSRIS